MKPKIRYKMEIYSNGDAQDQIINLLSYHNQGKCEFTLSELQTYLKMRSFIYPMTSNSQVEILGDGYAANIICNDKPFMHITREEIYELQES
jgi:hypothetical protein